MNTKHIPFIIFVFIVTVGSVFISIKSLYESLYPLIIAGTATASNIFMGVSVVIFCLITLGVLIFFIKKGLKK